jgi:hypothetical protein
MGGSASNTAPDTKGEIEMAQVKLQFGGEVKGVTGYVDGKKLTLEVDLSKEFGDSKSGKTVVIASTSGTVRLDGGLMIGLNVNKKK